MPGRCWLWPGMSPGGALGLQASSGLCLGAGWESGMLFHERISRTAGDLMTRHSLPGTLCALRPSSMPSSPPHNGRRDLPWASHFHVTPTYLSQAGRCLQMPGACPVQDACLPSYLSHEARKLPHQCPARVNLARTEESCGRLNFSSRCRLVSSPPHLPPPSLLTPTSNP